MKKYQVIYKNGPRENTISTHRKWEKAVRAFWKACEFNPNDGGPDFGELRDLMAGPHMVKFAICGDYQIIDL